MWWALPCKLSLFAIKPSFFYTILIHEIGTGFWRAGVVTTRFKDVTYLFSQWHRIMKHIWFTALALVVCAATSMAQEQPSTVKWHAQQTLNTQYHYDAQTVFVQRKIARHHQLTSGIKLALGIQHQHVLVDAYADETESILAKGSFVSLMFAQGTELQSFIQHDSNIGRVQQSNIDHSADLMGPVQWQVGYSHARMLDQQQALDQWVMGFVWPGEVQAKLLLAHGDDVQHYGYQNDTRMTLGVEKVFGF